MLIHGPSLRGAAAGGKSIRYSAEATALFGRMTTQPNAARKALIDAIYTAGKQDGWLTKLDGLWIMAAHDAQAARLNWVSTSFNLTAVASPTFTVDKGYKSDGAAAYLDTNFNPTTASSPKYLQDSASMFVFPYEDVAQSINDMSLIGSNFSLLTTRNASDQFQARSNYSAYSAMSFAATNSKVMAGWSRTTSSLTTAYRDGASVGTSPNPSAALISGNIGLLRGAGASFTTRGLAMACLGAGLTAGDVSAANTAIKSFLQTIGAV